MSDGQLAIRRLERQHAELQAPLRHFDRDLPRRHAPHVHLDVRMAAAESIDERQQRVNGRLIGADEHAPALQIAQLAHREPRPPR